MAVDPRILDVTPCLRRTLNMQSNLVRLFGFHSILRRFVLFTLMLILPACTTANGSLSATWTIASSSDSSLCAKYGATSVALFVNDPSGNPFSRVTPACSAMSTGIPNAPAGTYTVTAQMLDAHGNTVSSAIGPLSVSVTSGATATQNIDFPATSFTNIPGAGTLTINWTIENSTSASECSKFNAFNNSIQLTDASGNAIGGAHVNACTVFNWVMPNLAPGTYSVTSTLIGANGQAVSTAAGPNSVSITANTTTTSVIDFPLSAFLGANSTTGMLQVDWTIASGPASAQCNTYGAVNIAINLLDSSGNLYGSTTSAACSAQTTSVSNLAPGNYTVNAKLVDANGQAVSSTASASAVTITAGAKKEQAFDFPASSFTGSTGTTGTLEVDWTLAATTNASLCTAHNAVNIAVQVYDSSSSPYGAIHTASCSAFMILIASLPPGMYSVDGQMLDVNGQPATTKIPPQPVTIVAGTTTPEQFDFPATSFSN